MIAVVIISLSLLGVSGWLIDSHLRSWRQARDSGELSERERQFALAMLRRRLLASGTIAATGAAIAVGPAVPHQPMAMTVYLAVLLGACAWIMVLAMFDVVATRQYYRQLRSEQRAKQMQLATELAAMRENASFGNGAGVRQTVEAKG
jgi:hypothetical protein